MGLLSAVIYQRIRSSRARIVSALYPSLPSSIPARTYCNILLLSSTNSYIHKMVGIQCTQLLYDLLD